MNAEIALLFTPWSVYVFDLFLESGCVCSSSFSFLLPPPFSNSIPVYGRGAWRHVCGCCPLALKPISFIQWEINHIFLALVEDKRYSETFGSGLVTLCVWLFRKKAPLHFTWRQRRARFSRRSCWWCTVQTLVPPTSTDAPLWTTQGLSGVQGSKSRVARSWGLNIYDPAFILC